MSQSHAVDLPPGCVTHDYVGACQEALLESLQDPGLDVQEFFKQLLVLIRAHGITHNQRMLLRDAASQAMDARWHDGPGPLPSE
jgi:hypothetical protein